MGRNNMTEIGILLGYSRLKGRLTAEQETMLQQARHKLEHTSPKELVEQFLTYHQSGLTPRQPR